MNPAPYAAMILNHVGWVVYAVLQTDWFIFSADMIGLIAGVWIMFSLYPLASLTVSSANKSTCGPLYNSGTRDPPGASAVSVS